MPPACFLNAAGWHGAAVTDEGSPRAKASFCRFPAPRGPSSAPFGGTFPQRGKAFRLGNCRGPNNHQGSALKRGNRGTPTPLMGQPHNLTKQTGQAPHNRPKGVLRTLVLSGLLVTFLPREKSPAGGKEGRKYRRVPTKRKAPRQRVPISHPPPVGRSTAP